MRKRKRERETGMRFVAVGVLSHRRGAGLVSSNENYERSIVRERTRAPFETTFEISDNERACYGRMGER